MKKYKRIKYVNNFIENPIDLHLLFKKNNISEDKNYFIKIIMKVLIEKFKLENIKNDIEEINIEVFEIDKSNVYSAINPNLAKYVYLNHLSKYKFRFYLIEVITNNNKLVFIYGSGNRCRQIFSDYQLIKELFNQEIDFNKIKKDYFYKSIKLKEYLFEYIYLNNIGDDIIKFRNNFYYNKLELKEVFK